MTTPVEYAHSLEKARRMMDEYCTEPLDLVRISTVAGYSLHHFVRAFRQAFNITPHQYLTERRIERAKQLLSTNEMTVTDVCFAVGFQSLGSFSTLFARKVGYPPAVYRTRFTLLRRVPYCFLEMNGLTG